MAMVKSLFNFSLTTSLQLYLTQTMFVWGMTHRHMGHRTGIQRYYNNAIHWFTRVCKRDPDFYEARLQRGILLFREFGRSTDAIEDFCSILSVQPKHALALFNRGLAYEQSGQYKQALQDLETFTQLPIESYEYWHYANRLVKMLRPVVAEQNRQ